MSVGARRSNIDHSPLLLPRPVSRSKTVQYRPLSPTTSKTCQSEQGGPISTTLPYYYQDLSVGARRSNIDHSPLLFPRPVSRSKTVQYRLLSPTTSKTCQSDEDSPISTTLPYYFQELSIGARRSNIDHSPLLLPRPVSRMKTVQYRPLFPTTSKTYRSEQDKRIRYLRSSDLRSQFLEISGSLHLYVTEEFHYCARKTPHNQAAV